MKWVLSLLFFLVPAATAEAKVCSRSWLVDSARISPGDSDSYGEMYTSSGNASATSVSVSSTFYQAAGTVVAGSYLHNFTVGGSTLMYSGSETHKFLVSASASVLLATKDKDLAITIGKNGVPISKSHMRVRIAKEDVGWPVATHAIVELTTNDYLDLQICNRSDTTDPTVESMVFEVVQID